MLKWVAEMSEFYMNSPDYYGIRYTMKLAPTTAVTITAVIIMPFLVVLRLFPCRSTSFSLIPFPLSYSKIFDLLT